MSIKSISNSSFSLAPLNKDAYQLDVQFLDEGDKPLSKRSAIFVQAVPVKAGITWDLYSQNGVCSDGIFTQKDEALFRHQDEDGIKRAIKKLGDKPKGPVVIVLDLKDKDKSYVDGGSIAGYEDLVCKFLSSDEVGDEVLPRAKKVHQMIKKGIGVDYVLCEGRLKHLLLGGFSESEADYFLNRDPVAFCQYAEYFMNGLKLGQVTKAISADDVFKPIFSSNAYSPQGISTVLYPAAYKDIYSVDGPFFKTMKPVFDIKGNFDGKITSVSVVKK